VTRWAQSGSNNALLGSSGRAFALVDAVPPGGIGRKGRQLSKAFVHFETTYGLGARA
jgi:hypothetical protein